ncbi:hypothetical protein [Haemophilus sp. SZY H52]|jgi:hypothetical protein|uniref:hypothetical protein n=1 Tax=Haemophilus sp. SZY H52 TaxID=3042471 RepID=UPI003510F7BF
MNINDFKTLLINRSEIENILGRTISVKNSDNDYLEDYRLFPELSLHDVTCLILDMWPKDWNAHQHPRYETIKEAIKQSAERGYISARIENDINGNVEDVFLTHEAAEKWARTYGLKWNVPPYRKPLEVARDNSQIIELKDQSDLSVNSTELQEEKAKNTLLQTENERLKAELKAQQDRMTELEQKLQQGAVDSEPVLENAKAYDVRERETHLLMIGALSNLLAGYKQKYQKGNGGINQSAISKDIESEIIELLQPETKTRTNDTIRPRIRESLNLITKAE